MRKSKILSMLLAACMVLPCLPVAATATAAPTTQTNTPVGVNLLDPYGTTDLTDPANWTMSTGQTATQIKVDDPDGNGSNTYLRTDDFNSADTWFHLFLDSNKIPAEANNTPGFNTSGKYIVKLDIRAQAGDETTSPYNTDGHRIYPVYRQTNSYTDSLNQSFAKTQFDLTGGTVSNQATVEFYPGKAGVEVSIFFQNHTNGVSYAPKEIDNIAVYKVIDQNGTKTESHLYTYTFEEATNAVRGIVRWYNSKTQELLSPVTEYDHLRVNASNSADAKVTRTPSSPIVLTPGKYELTFDSRQSYFFSNPNHNSSLYDDEKGYTATGDYAGWYIRGADNKAQKVTDTTKRYHMLYKANSTSNWDWCADTVNANYRDVALTLATDKALTNVKLDGEAFNGTFHVTNSWDSYKLTFEVPAGETVTLSSLSFGGTGKAYDNDAFDLSRISLKLIPEGTSRPVYGADDNFLDNAKENYNGGIYTDHDLNTANGYISVDKRPWIITDDNGISGVDVGILKVNLSEKPQSGYTYYVQFDVREAVPSDSAQKLMVRWSDDAWGRTPVSTEPLSYGWVRYIFKNDEAFTWSVNKNIEMVIRRDASDPQPNLPLDIDNITVWKEASGGDGKYTTTDSLLYSEDYNNPETDYVSGKLSSSAIGEGISRIFEKDYGKLMAETPVLSYTDLNGGTGHEEGVYAFSADIRVPYYRDYNLKNESNWRNEIERITLKDGRIGAYYPQNNHKAKITFTMTPVDGGSDVTVTRTADVNYLWSTFEAAVTVEKGYKLTKIDITPEFNTAFTIPAEARGLDFANVKLNYAEYPIIETQDSKNYLADTTVYTENVLPKEVVVEDTNGYLYVGKRGTDAFHVFSITMNHSPRVGKQYYIEYDITSTDSSYTENGVAFAEIRPQLNIRLKGDHVAHNLGYIESATGSTLKTYAVTGGEWFLAKLVDNVTYHFKGQFTPTSSASSLVYTFVRGRSADYNSNIMIDNFRVYYMDGNKQVDVYNNDFQSETALEGISKVDTTNTSYEVEHILPLNYTLYTPMDNTQPMKLTYDIQLTDAEKVEGKYQFKTEVKLAEASEGTAKARVLFNFSDGSSQVHYIDITEKWTTIGIADRLERYPTLETVTVEFDTDVPVMMRDSSLYITYRWQYGKPNTGIVMVLIKKMHGMMTDPWRGLA